MSNYIDSIQLSGTVYTIQGSGGGSGNPTVELTQAEYDALVSAGTVSANTYYIITDAQAGDLTQYWTSSQTQSAITQATSGKVDTSAITSSVTSASTDSQIPTAKAVFDAIPTGGTGGGKAIAAGRGISVTTGETADTINCTLNVKNGTNGGIVVGDGECSSTGLYSISIGHNADVGGYYSLCMGSNSYCNGQQSIVLGDSSNSNTDFTYCFGRNLRPNRTYQFLEGVNLHSNNEYEVAFGQYNVSSKSSGNYGNSGNTLFSIGNGYDFSSTHNWHNAFEIRQNGDIYIANTNDTSITGDKAYSLYPMIKLQDHLGGGGVSYSAGTGIDITNNVISVSGVVETSAITTSVTSSSTDAQVPSAKAVYDIVGNIETLLSQI